MGLTGPVADCPRQDADYQRPFNFIKQVGCVLALAGIDLGRVATPTAVVRAAQMQGSPCQLIINQETS
jgi:hypothetical protein